LKFAANRDQSGWPRAHAREILRFGERALDSRSTMAHGIFRAAAVESAAKAGIAPPEDHRRF
jgi:hypothetical protein